jgi:hypothetical protein
VNDLVARQMIRQRTPRRLLRLAGGLDRRGDNRRGNGEPFGLVGLQRFDRQFELVRLERQLLRGPAELGTTVTGELEAQLGDLGLGGDRIVRHRRNDPLQRFGVVGKLIGRDRHLVSESPPPVFGVS